MTSWEKCCFVANHNENVYEKMRKAISLATFCFRNFIIAILELSNFDKKKNLFVLKMFFIFVFQQLYHRKILQFSFYYGGCKRVHKLEWSVKTFLLRFLLQSCTMKLMSCFHLFVSHRRRWEMTHL